MQETAGSESLDYMLPIKEAIRIVRSMVSILLSNAGLVSSLGRVGYDPRELAVQLPHSLR
jgi:hypothetical protein